MIILSFDSIDLLFEQLLLPLQLLGLESVISHATAFIFYLLLHALEVLFNIYNLLIISVSFCVAGLGLFMNHLEIQTQIMLMLTKMI